MEYQVMINLLDNTPNQQSKFGTKNWVEINDDARVEIIVPLKYLNNFWRSFKMPQINYEINLILIWSEIVLYNLILLQIKKIAITKLQNFMFQL